LLLQAYAYVSPRADGLSRQRGQRFASGTSAMFSGATKRPRNHGDNGRVGDSFSSMPAVQHSVRTYEHRFPLIRSGSPRQYRQGGIAPV
jgi:hypothetical protein